MSDNIDIPIQVSGGAGIDAITTSIDRLHAALGGLGNVSGLDRLTAQMEQMTSATRTGFAELANALKKHGNDQAAQITANGDKAAAAITAANQKMMRADAETFRQITEGRSANVAKAFSALATGIPIELVQKQWGEVATKTAAGMNHELEKLKQFQANTRSLYETHYNTLAGATEAQMQKAHAMNQAFDAKRMADAAASAAHLKEQSLALSWQNFLELEAAKERQRTMAAAAAASAAEKQRSLNTNFLTASPSQQLALATKAQIYAGLGGDASAKYGSAAAGADIRALTAEHQKLQQTIPRTVQATADHSNAMREAHSLARGLAGSLGGLWLTYGSVAPLLAGAALAGSMKQIVSAGKEVEQQLNFVFALSSNDGKGINLDSFLQITDGSLRSVVESANAMRALAQNGLQASQSLQVLPSILDLATVGEMQVGQAALAATGAVSAFGLSFAEAGRVSDIFAQTAATSNTSVLAITESMKQASTVASLFKVTIEETAGVLGVLAKINITGGAAGTSMTNMLTGLYEPTEKGKRAMRELGLETYTATGALKPFTQVMEELRSKLSGFNDSAKVDILGSIFTVRGVKAAQQIQENLGEFKKKTEEATTAAGYMRGVVMQLEDSTEGSFKRLSVSIENTFVKSFAKASPYVQQLGLHLSDAFKEGGSVGTNIGNLAQNLARLTGFLFDNLSAVVALTAAYIGFRALGPVIALFQAATAASAASAVAQAAATAASIAHTSALAGGAATVAMYTAMIETQTVATNAATLAQARWAAVSLPALAALAIAVAGAAALYLLFRDNSDAAEVANTKMSNSLHVIGEQMDKEIKRLKESNALWDERNGKFREAGSVTPDALSQAETNVRNAEKALKLQGLDPDKARNAEVYVDAGSGMSSMVDDAGKLGTNLLVADGVLARLQERDRQYKKEITPGQAKEKTQLLTQQLGQDIDKFAKQAEEKDSAGNFYQADAKIRAVQEGAKKIKAAMLDANQILQDPAEEEKRLGALRVDLKKSVDLVNSMQQGRAAKVEGQNDALQAEVKKFELRKQAAAFASQEAIADARVNNKTGKLGDLQLINFELAEKTNLHKENIKALQAQFALEDNAGKKSKAQDYTNKIGAENSAIAGAAKEAERAKAASMRAMAQTEVQEKVKSLNAQGKYEEAFRLSYEQDHRNTLDNIERDLLESTDEGYKAQLRSYRSMLEQMEVDGMNAALGDKLARQFGDSVDAMELKLAQLSASSGAGSGLATIFDNAYASQQTLLAALPELESKYQEMQALADSTGTIQDKNSAKSMLAELTKTAAQARNVWVGLGQTIEQSLTKAFGNSGKALGSMLNTYISFGAKRKQIDADYERTVKADPSKRIEAEKTATRELASAQINAYADMAGAAQGFFKEGTRGYQVLGAAEKAFRIAELAMTAESMFAKLFATTTTTTAAVAGTQAEIIAEKVKVLDAEANTSEIINLAMAEGQASATAGVAGQARGDPYSAWVRMAAMAAVMAGLGFAVSGGGGRPDTTAKDRQEAAGTGSVFGDIGTRKSDGSIVFGQKSESISKSLDMVEKYTKQGLGYSEGMLTALRNIQSTIGNVTNLAIRSGALQRAGDIRTGTISQGLGGGSGIGGLATKSTIASGLAMMTPFGAVIAGVAYVVDKLTKTTQTVLDEGFKINRTTVGSAAEDGTTGSTYANVETKKKFLGITYSDKKSQVNTGALDSELGQQFGLVIESLRNGVLAAADVLQLGGDAFTERLNSFVIDISEISTKGLTGDQIQKQFETIFSKLGDDMAKFSVAGLEPFQKAGEGYLETLTRIAVDYQTVDAVMAQLGLTFGAVGTDSIHLREALIDMSGGLDKFIEQGDYFAKNFLSDEERNAPIKAQLDKALAPFSQGGPIDSIEKFKDVVRGLKNTADPAMAKTYVKLMALAPAFKEVTDAVTAAADKIKDEAQGLQDDLDDATLTKAELLQKERNKLLSEENKLLFDQVQAAKGVIEARDNLTTAYEAERDAIQETIDRVAGLAKSWKKFRDGLLLGDKSPLTNEQKYMEAKRQYESTLTKARGGDKDAQDSLQDISEKFLEASRVSFSSSDQYTQDFNQVLSATSEMAKWAEGQVDVGQATLEALKAQVGSLIKIEEATLSVAAAIQALATAMGDKGKDVVSQSQTAGITSLYKNLLHRDPEQAGLDYWKDAMTKGLSLNDVAAYIQKSDEYMKAHDDGLNYGSQSKRQAQQDAAEAQAEPGPTAAQMAELLRQIAELRREAGEQTGAMMGAQYGAAQAGAEVVGEAVTTAVKSSVWDKENNTAGIK